MVAPSFERARKASASVFISKEEEKKEADMAPASFPVRLAYAQGLEHRQSDTPGFGESIVSLETVHRGARIRVKDTVGIPDIISLLL
jgi:hypothetical protein